MILSADHENGIIKLDGVTLSGVLQSLTVNGEILIDSNNSAANNESRKVMRGYKDKTVSLSLKILPTEDKTVYDILEELENSFQDKVDNTPKVMTITNKHIIARGIDEVLFTGLTSSEDNSTETLNVSLNFEEFISAKYQ